MKICYIYDLVLFENGTVGFFAPLFLCRIRIRDPAGSATLISILNNEEVERGH
jgi:hypothetical protein